MTEWQQLEECRGYGYWTPEIDRRAEEAARRGCLIAAHQRALERYYEAQQPSSNSSVTVTVIPDAPNDQQFIFEEINRALGRLV
jgi:hypothetical protein